MNKSLRKVLNIVIVFMLFFSCLQFIKAEDTVKVINNYNELYDTINEGKLKSLRLLNDIEVAAKNESESLQILNEREVQIDMNSKKIFTPLSDSYNRPFSVKGGTLTVKNGSIIANGGGTNKDNGYGVFGSIGMNAGNLNLENMYLENYRPWGLNIKTGKGTANLKNVTMKSIYGGGIEVSGGTANMYECDLTQTEYFDHCSTLVSASTGGSLNVYSGNYIGDNWIVYVYDSGATINLYGGSFKAGRAVIKADKSVSSTSSIVNVYGGEYDGKFEIAKEAFLNISAGVFKNTGLSKEEFTKYVVNTSKINEIDGVFTVSPKTSSVELSKTSLSLDVAKSETLVAKLNPNGAIDPITWTSSNTKVATVDATGKVTAIAEGTAKITATAGGESATCTVTVKKVEVPVEPEKPVVPDKPTVEVPTIDTTTPPKEVTVGVQDKASQEVVADTVSSILGNITSGKEVSKDVMSEKTLQAVKDAVAAGKEVTPKVEAKTVDVKTVDKTIVNKVNELVEKFSKVNETKATVAQYLDLGVLLMADAKELGTVNQLDKAIEFTVALPTDLVKEGRVFYVVRIHNGVAEKLTTSMNEDGTLTFETDKFSTYAIVYEEGTKKEEIRKEEVVKTNDSTNTLLWITTLGFGLFVGARNLIKVKEEQ